MRANASTEPLHAAFRARLQHLNEFIEGLAVADLSNGSYQRVAALINSQRLLEATGTTLYDFVTTVALCGPRLAGITDIVVEAMDGVLLTLEAALSQPDEDEMQMLRTMTGNRSSALQALRNYSSPMRGSSTASRAFTCWRSRMSANGFSGSWAPSSKPPWSSRNASPPPPQSPDHAGR